MDVVLPMGFSAIDDASFLDGIEQVFYLLACFIIDEGLVAGCRIV